MTSGTEARRLSETDERTDQFPILDPRTTMLQLPAWTQAGVTVLTGKAYPGQKRIRMSAMYHLVGAVLSVLVGVLASTVSVLQGGLLAWIGALAGITVTLHGLRNLRMLIFHQAAHKNLFRRKRIDELIGQCCSAVLLVQNFSDYSREHTADHHSRHHMTLRDPTVQALLIGIGVRPGMTRKQMWRRLAFKLISPWFHFSFAVSRLRSFWIGASGRERMIAAGFHGSIIIATAISGQWLVFAVAWLVPLFPLFQVCNTLRLCVKHTFPNSAEEGLSGKARMASLTNAIFLGESCPSAQLEWWRRWPAWGWWLMRMVCIHAPARYLVMTGDTVVHDLHHRHPRLRQWTDYLSERTLDDPNAGGWPPYSEVWGLREAISHVFDSISVARPETFDRNLIVGADKRSMFAAFDD